MILGFVRPVHLTGKILCAWSAALLAACAALPPAQPLPQLPDPLPAVLLLGEVHDNAEGHARRLELLRQLLQQGWRPAIALEQFDREQQAALTAAQAGCGEDTDCLIRTAATADSGWDWRHYRPVIELAQQYRLPLLAANLSRPDARRLIQGGLAALPPEDGSLRESLRQIPEDVLREQAAAVADGHCHLLPVALLPAMATAQVARDMVMADILRLRLPEPVVLLAGNGHVRRDIGVPRWLPEAYAIGFVERPDAVGPAPYDQVERVRPETRPDPCAGVMPPAAASPR